MAEISIMRVLDHPNCVKMVLISLHDEFRRFGIMFNCCLTVISSELGRRAMSYLYDSPAFVAVLSIYTFSAFR
jgi:hypothetical protein